jgi:SNF2 family DNA or RNA helicase
VAGYKNLHELHDILSPISTRVTKAEVLKDLPPKLYTTRYFEMSPEQEKIYKQIEDEFMVMLEGHVLTMELALTRLLRLQQVTCGYLPRPDAGPEDQPYLILPGKPARLDALLDITSDISTQGIIWARFTKDIDNICAMLNEKGNGGAVRYDGTQNEDQRTTALKKFRNQSVQWFVGNPAVGGEGLTLTEAKSVIYYNNSFKFIERSQSEDRAHRIGQDTSVSYIDIAAIGTVDEDIVRALIKKLDIANIITGDSKKSWLDSPDQAGSENFELFTDAVSDVLNMINR